MNDEKQKAMDKALRLLSSRAHTRFELTKKLKDKGFSGTTVSETIKECERLNLIDDKSFAEFYIEELTRKSYGPFKIRNALIKKGLEREIIASVMERDSKEDELERAEKALSTKLRNLEKEEDPRKRKEKVFRFLASRGFSRDIIYKLLDGLKKK